MVEQKVLNKLVKGAGVLFIAMFLGKVFAFLYKILLARYLGPAEYGILSLGLTVFGVLTVMSLFGPSSALKRFVAIYKSKENHAKVKGVIWSVIQLSLFVG